MVEITPLVRLAILGLHQDRYSADPAKVAVVDFLTFLMQNGIETPVKHGFSGATTFTGFFYVEDLPEIETWLRDRGLDILFTDKEYYQDPA